MTPPDSPSRTHLVLIPSYNPGRKVFETVQAARAHWSPVWVVVDGSTDGTGAALVSMAERDPGLRVLVRPGNGGKGAAVTGETALKPKGDVYRMPLITGMRPGYCVMYW